MTRTPIQCAVAAALLLGLAAAPAVAEDAATPAAPAPSATPAASAMAPAPAAAVPADGELDNSCTFGLTKGLVVNTECSLNWTAPDVKKNCFSSESSKEAFLQSTTENIQKAKEFF